MDPLEYWKNSSYKYPYLSILARRYLAILATLATIKSIFSVSNNIIIKPRNRLNLETVRMLLLLKSWKIKNLSELEKELGLEDIEKED